MYTKKEETEQNKIKRKNINFYTSKIRKIKQSKKLKHIKALKSDYIYIGKVRKNVCLLYRIYYPSHMTI